MKRAMYFAEVQIQRRSLAVVVASVAALWAHAIGAHPTDAEYCQALVGINSEEIQYVSPDVTDDDETKAIEMRSANSAGRVSANEIQGVYRVDIDNDGEIDNVVLTAGGTARFRTLNFFDAEWRLKALELAGFEDDDLSPGSTETAGIDRFRGRTYITEMWTSTRELAYAVVLDQGKYRLICRFGYDKTPQEYLVVGQGNPVCDAVLGGDVDYVELAEPHGLRSDAQCFEDNGPDCAKPTGTSGMLDIDNDGVDERVVSMRVSWGGGRGCGFDFLAIPEPDGSQLKRVGNGKLLLDATATWGDSCPGAVSRPFRYQGVVYIENKYQAEYPRNYHHVVRIAAGAVDEVCTFSVARKPFLIQPQPTAVDHTAE